MQSYSDDRTLNASGVIVSGRTSGGRSNRRLQLLDENRYRYESAGFDAVNVAYRL